MTGPLKLIADLQWVPEQREMVKRRSNERQPVGLDEFAKKLVRRSGLARLLDVHLEQPHRMLVGARVESPTHDEPLPVVSDELHRDKAERTCAHHVADLPSA
ncbi:hypothetical protein [Kribbella albertanoniae]|uniref:Uncharacterized protein n=1 Tax=Kribbella albertanoniae TaxID=1266829 RepID=A0A4R4Q2P3_9ACTN|nr:hypothetical protein [Kribbella albertanoniae]TDC29267.1 hypothetical protein E1261_16145 [Kribbella albertanoniae]